MDTKFFTDKAGKVDPLAEEVSICGNVVEENTYNYSDLPDSYKDAILKIDPNLRVEHLDQVGFQLADGVTHLHDKFSFMFQASSDERLFDLFPGKRLHSDFVVNSYANGEIGFKVFDLDYASYDKPELPPGSVPGEHVGVGLLSNSEHKGIYFAHRDAMAVSEFFNLPLPYVEELHDVIYSSDYKVFGINYTTDPLVVHKLKFYHYPKGNSDLDSLYDELNERSS